MGDVLSGSTLLVIGIGLIVLCVCLTVAPLLIWRHTRRSAEALEAMRDHHKAEAAALRSTLSHLGEQLALIREAVKASQRQQPARAPVAQNGACAECGAMIEVPPPAEGSLDN
jgi:type VI protein secretion system component VasK